MSELLQVKASSIAASSVLGGEVLVPTEFFRLHSTERERLACMIVRPAAYRAD